MFPSTPPQKGMFYDEPWFPGKTMSSPEFKFPPTPFGSKPYGVLNTKAESFNKAVATKPLHVQQARMSFQVLCDLLYLDIVFSRSSL